MRRVSTSRRKKQDRPGRLRLFFKRQRKNLRFGLPILAGVLVIGGMVLLVQSADPSGHIGQGVNRLTAAAGLSVREIRYEGRNLTPEPLLHAAVSAPIGASIFSVSPTEIRERVETLSWVESASVERVLPGTLVVRIVERAPFAVWQNNGRYTLIDRSGHAIEAENIGAFSNLPLVVGAGAPMHAEKLLQLLGHYPAIQGRVKALVRVSERRWNLSLESGVDIMLPEGHEDAALQRLLEIDQREGVLARPLSSIDMRLPDRMVLRPRSESPASGSSVQRRPV